MIIDSRVTGRTKILCLIGNPIEHSISPQLHNTISRELGLDIIYIPFKVEKRELESAARGLKALNVMGFNVTVPFKNEILKYIDKQTQETLLMGAVNTVKNVNGIFYGYNTDAEGFLKSFYQESETGFLGKEVVIIGAGGASRAIAVKIALEGSKRINLVNRTIEKSLEISEIINNNIDNIANIYTFEDEDLRNVFESSSIIINTTSVGMYPDIGSSPISDNSFFSSNQIVYDVIYNPNETKFLKSARKRGCKTINGAGMLFYQGVFAYEIWTEKRLSAEFIENAYRAYTNMSKGRS